MNLFYRKPRAFATTRRHSFSATDGCTSPSVRLSPSAVCRLRVAFRELAFSKSDFRGRVKFRFFTCFSSVAYVASCTKPHSRCAERFLAFSHVLQPFSPNRVCQILFYTARALPLGRDLQAMRLRIVVALLKKRFSVRFRSISDTLFNSQLSHFEFTVYRHSFEKGNPVGRKPIFERALYCKIIIVVRLWDDAGIVRIKCEERTALPSAFKAVSHRARHSCRLVRLSPLHSASRMIPSFSVLFLRFFVLSVLLVRSHGFSVCFSAFSLRFSVLFLRFFLCFLCVPMGFLCVCSHFFRLPFRPPA